eukprot:scaffold17823_cov145-Amphora_coffeaeformis.AAC.1
MGSFHETWWVDTVAQPRRCITIPLVQEVINAGYFEAQNVLKNGLHIALAKSFTEYAENWTLELLSFSKSVIARKSTLLSTTILSEGTRAKAGCGICQHVESPDAGKLGKRQFLVWPRYPLG